MKGLILAGGSGSRLHPLTKTTSKQLLAVYDKPMIYYPLATLLFFGIRDVLVISTPADTPSIERLLGDGGRLGISIEYAIQKRPDGIAQAFMIGETFIGGEDVALVLGDNIFCLGDHVHRYIDNRAPGEATIFSYYVPDPERFGIIEFNKNLKVVSIEEKPRSPKSNQAIVGLYFYPGDVSEKVGTLRPSKRGELEITDLNNLYLREGRLRAIPLERGNVWFDAGTHDNLIEASLFVQIMEKRQGLIIGCIEEIAYRQGFITRRDLSSLAVDMGANGYRDYLMRVCGEDDGG